MDDVTDIVGVALVAVATVEFVRETDATAGSVFIELVGVTIESFVV